MEETINWIIERNIQDSADGVAFNNEKSAKEIADTFKRFIEWAIYKIDYNSREEAYEHPGEDGVFFTLDELFKYWSEVIDQKRNER